MAWTEEMTQPFDVAAGLWWRFDRYEIRDNYIRPSPGAKLEKYDPWADYRAGRARGKGAEPPYQSLLALHESVVFRPGGEGHSPFKLTSESEASLLAWCADHGLLGILLQLVQQIVLAPRWRPILHEPERSGSEKGATPNNALVPILCRYTRTNTGWRTTQSETFSEDAPRVLDAPELEGQVISSDHRPKNFPQPHVLIQQLANPVWEREVLSKSWGRFFPDVGNEEKETFSYPRPASPQFWKLYAEPLDTFLNGAIALRNAVRDLGHKPLGNTTEEDEWTVLRGMKGLHALVAPISPAIYPVEDGSFEQRWIAPSLLGSFAMMVLQDLTEQKRVLSCEVCKKLFLSAAYQAQYCSDTCRHTAQKRRWRAKKKEKSHGQTRSE